MKIFLEFDLWAPLARGENPIEARKAAGRATFVECADELVASMAAVRDMIPVSVLFTIEASLLSSLRLAGYRLRPKTFHLDTVYLNTE
jgi:hypothetical protein